MKVWVIYVVAAVVILGLGGFLLTRYGQARYDAGYSAAGKDQADAQDTADADAKKDIENAERETNNLDDPGVDRELRGLGIMRQPTDR